MYVREKDNTELYKKAYKDYMELKQDIEKALQEAKRNKIYLEKDTNNRGRYDAYLYIWNKMREMGY